MILVITIIKITLFQKLYMLNIFALIMFVKDMVNTNKAHTCLIIKNPTYGISAMGHTQFRHALTPHTQSRNRWNLKTKSKSKPNQNTICSMIVLVRIWMGSQWGFGQKIGASNVLYMQYEGPHILELPYEHAWWQ